MWLRTVWQGTTCYLGSQLTTARTEEAAQGSHVADYIFVTILQVFSLGLGI